MEYNQIGQSAMFTGHRCIPTTERKALEYALDATIHDLFQKGIRNFISGAALGFDTMAAKAVCRVRDAGLPITLTLAIPCMHQELRWPQQSRKTYADLFAVADHVVYTSYTPYYQGCMQVRNRYMVEHASVCVAYFNGHQGGTAATWRLANRLGRLVINLCEHAADPTQISLEETEISES